MTSDEPATLELRARLERHSLALGMAGWVVAILAVAGAAVSSHRPVLFGVLLAVCVAAQLVGIWAMFTPPED